MRAQDIILVVAAGATISATTQDRDASPSASVAKSTQTPATRVYLSPCSQNVDVCDVLAQYASLTGLKIVRDNFVQGKVSMDDVSKLPKNAAIEIIERTLFANGFSLTQIHPDTVEITGLGRHARSNGIPVITDPKALPSHERLVSFVFAFKHRDAEEMVKMFYQYISPPSSWTSLLAEPKGNTVLVTERTSVIRALIDIAANMDVPDRQKQP